MEQDIREGKVTELIECSGFPGEPAKITIHACKSLRSLPVLPVWSTKPKRPAYCEQCAAYKMPSKEEPMGDTVLCKECGKEPGGVKTGLCHRCYSRIWISKKKKEMSGKHKEPIKAAETNSNITISPFPNEYNGTPVTVVSQWPADKMKPELFTITVPDELNWLLGKLSTEAAKELRTLENQALWILSRHFSD